MSHQQFDEHIKNQFNAYEPEVPVHMWQRIADARGIKNPSRFIVPFDNYVKDQLSKYEPEVPAKTWDAVTEQRFDNFLAGKFNNYQPVVSVQMWDNILAARKDDKRPVFWFWLGRTAVAALLLLLVGGVGYMIWNGKGRQTTDNGQQTTDNGQRTAESEMPSVYNGQDETTTNFNNNKTDVYSPVNGAVMLPANGIDKNITAPYFNLERKAKKIDGLNSNPFDMDYESEVELEKRNNEVGPFEIAKNTEARPVADKKWHAYKMPDCPIGPNDNMGGNYWEFYAGPDYGFKILNDLSGNTTYLQQRKDAAKFSSAFSAGVRYTKVFNNGSSVRAGVNYSQINETLKVLQGGIIQVVYILNAQGDTIGSYTVNGTRYQKIHNRYKSIDIPVQLGYEINTSEKVSVNISAGPVINVRSWQKGATIDTGGNVVSITTGKAKKGYEFKTNTGVGFIGSATVYYKLNDGKTSLFAEPYFRYNIAAMNDMQNSTIKQKYNTAGLRLGLRVKF